MASDVVTTSRHLALDAMDSERSTSYTNALEEHGCQDTTTNWQRSKDIKAAKLDSVHVDMYLCVSLLDTDIHRLPALTYGSAVGVYCRS